MPTVLPADGPPRVWIGYDPRETVAVHVLAESIQAHASIPVLIGQVRLDQLRSVHTRTRHPKQSTDFSFSRFLVPWLCGYQGWGMFIDADMIAVADIAELWALRDDRYAVMVVQHRHECDEGLKFQGMPQTPYQRKNWSSVMLFNAARCTQLTTDYVNTASGLDLHQFRWLEDDQIGSLPPEWNVLVGVQPIPDTPRILHYTLGGPWFDDCRAMAESDRWLRGLASLNHPLPSPGAGLSPACTVSGATTGATAAPQSTT